MGKCTAKSVVLMIFAIINFLTIEKETTKAMGSEVFSGRSGESKTRFKDLSTDTQLSIIWGTVIVLIAFLIMTIITIINDNDTKVKKTRLQTISPEDIVGLEKFMEKKSVIMQIYQTLEKTQQDAFLDSSDFRSFMNE